jgi:DNA modification methylase
MMEIDRIYNMDCLEGMKEIPDGSVDLIVTDPPYEFETRGAGFHKKRVYYDEIAAQGLAKGIDETYLVEMERIMKQTNTYLFCNKNQLRMYFNFYKDKNCDLLVWHKNNPIPVVSNKYLSDLEYIFFARDKGVRLGGDYSTLSKVYRSNVNKADLNLYGHPTIKPLPLVARLILNSSQEGGVVCDPFMGSGTTAIACIREKRHFIGFELNEEYFDKAQKRIQAEQSQLKLF